ncbi:MAG: ATP synthase subunit I [bacterium]|nr:ATP synthase subunit I [bacterium]
MFIDWLWSSLRRKIECPRMEDDYNQLQLEVISFTLVLAGVGGLFCSILGRIDWVFGLWLGTVASLFNFCWLARDINRLLTMTSGQARRYFRYRRLLRYGALSLAMVLAVKVVWIAVATTIIGFFMVKIAICLRFISFSEQLKFQRGAFEMKK